MVKIMRPVQNLSLRKSLVLYIVLFVMFALALSIMTASVCETVADKINEKYPNTGEKYYLTNEQGERLGEGTYIYKELPVLNEQDEQLLAILDLLPTVTSRVDAVRHRIIHCFLRLSHSSDNREPHFASAS